MNLTQVASSTIDASRPGFARFEKMCPPMLYLNLWDGVCSRIEVSGFYSYCLQYALVAFMYFHVGKGKYWKILYYSSIMGLIGGLVENVLVAYVCRVADVKKSRPTIILFLINEVFWIMKEYAVPFLNLIKMKAFSGGRASAKIINYVIYALFFVFAACKFYIGYQRFQSGLLITDKSKLGYTAAYITIAVSDLICTFSILIYVKQHNKQHLNSNGANINHFIKRSSYMTLVLVDLISILLALVNFISSVNEKLYPSSYITPFYSMNTTFILILACDAMVFKYSVNTNSTNVTSSTNKSGNNSSSHNNYKYSYGNNSGSHNNYKLPFVASNNSNNNNIIHQTAHMNTNTTSNNNNSSSNNNYSATTKVSNISTPYIYSSTDYPKDTLNYQGKSIVKNYTTIRTTDSPSSPSSFGFLYQQ